MNIRMPFRAGSFYEASASSCRHHAQRLIDSAGLPDDLPGPIYGGLVPHAGWMFSGRLAAMTFRAVVESGPVDTVVLLGADHTGTVTRGEVYESGVWRTPLGEVAVDEDLAGRLLRRSEAFRPNANAHAYEHSLEVQVPFIQLLAPEARILPIGVPPSDLAVQIGRDLGEVLAEGPAAAVVGSTDLTHHGGHFPAPGGHGEQGVRWTVQNDRRMLDRIEAMDAEAIVPEARARQNACGAGAIAAALAACKQRGAERGIVLEYTNSYEVVHKMYPDDRDDTTVGYASVVFA
jgi:hypothetical protein